MVHFHFVAKEPGDPYLDTYLAHEIPPVGDQRWPRIVYCPDISNHDVPEDFACAWCSDDEIKTKERMIMWLYVYDVLHREQDANDQEKLERITYNGEIYFRRPINAPRIWETSAWRESPLESIILMFHQTGDLRSTRFILNAVGAGLKRRYMITPNLNPQVAKPFDPQLLKETLENIEPVRKVLLESIQEPSTRSRPATNGTEEPKPYEAVPSYEQAAAELAGNNPQPFDPSQFRPPDDSKPPKLY